MFEVFVEEEKWITMKALKSFLPRFVGYMAQGLEGLKREALWFPDCQSLHTCFMRFSLDLYFLDADHQIISVRESVKPFSFVFQRGADSVIELPSGSKKRLKVGDKLRFVPCA
jgi:uncharacterized membrane protein (UPF0127 family)